LSLHKYAVHDELKLLRTRETSQLKFVQNCLQLEIVPNCLQNSFTVGNCPKLFAEQLQFPAGLLSAGKLKIPCNSQGYGCFVLDPSTKHCSALS
jgi:hypothetical protein